MEMYTSLSATALPHIGSLVIVFMPVDNLTGRTTASLSLLCLMISHGNFHAREVGSLQLELQNFKNISLKI